MSSFQLLARRSLHPVASSLVSASIFFRNEGDYEGSNISKYCSCDTGAGISTTDPVEPISSDVRELKKKYDKNTLSAPRNEVKNIESQHQTKNSKVGNSEELFHDLFPLRQLWSPKVTCPLWDKNWDGRDLDSTGSKEADRARQRLIRKKGVTRHIILVRHGQYDETHQEDEKRILTPLGRRQAEFTGKRIAEMIQGFDEKFGACNVTTIRVSDMARAKETADIIAKHLPSHVHRADPDANLNEGRPCHTIPGRASRSIVEQVDESHSRIETAFQRYFYRASYHEGANKHKASTDNESEGTCGIAETVLPSTTLDGSKSNQVKTDQKDRGHPQHEFEIIVCHGNVIRYMFCRALQIPPEAWLRLCTFNCSLTYFTIRSTGSVSCRMLGDIGHLGYDHSTFSMHHGFNW